MTAARKTETWVFTMTGRHRALGFKMHAQGLEVSGFKFEVHDPAHLRLTLHHNLIEQRLSLLEPPERAAGDRTVVPLHRDHPPSRAIARWFVRRVLPRLLDQEPLGLSTDAIRTALTVRGLGRYWPRVMDAILEWTRSGPWGGPVLGMPSEHIWCLTPWYVLKDACWPQYDRSYGARLTDIFFAASMGYWQDRALRFGQQQVIREMKQLECNWEVERRVIKRLKQTTDYDGAGMPNSPFTQRATTQTPRPPITFPDGLVYSVQYGSPPILYSTWHKQGQVWEQDEDGTITETNFGNQWWTGSILNSLRVNSRSGRDRFVLGEVGRLVLELAGRNGR